MTSLEKLSGCENPDRCIDLIFVHGLDGDAKSTWQRKDRPETFWPGWLGEDFPATGLWSLDYDASSMAWRGDSMPLYDRANNVLDLFDLDGIGKRPIGFVCHSLGGLLIKQVLRNANDSNNPVWTAVLEQTGFIVFLSTPHSGAGMANWIQYLGKILRTTISVTELQAHHTQLRQLNDWYRDHCADLGIRNFVYCEERKTGRSLFGLGGILVVDKTSADPCIPGLRPIVLDEDHISICKPESRTAAVYLKVKQMTEESIHSGQSWKSTTPKPARISTPAPETKVEKIMQSDLTIPGKTRLEFCRRLGESWRSLARILVIQQADRALFTKGEEAQNILDWLENRRSLHKLRGALTEIGREDLAKVLPNPN